MARAFAEPATGWRGAFLRAAAWSGPQICGALAVEQLGMRPWREGLAVALMIGAVPVGLAVIHRSWRVGVASAAVAVAVVAGATAAVTAWVRVVGIGG